MEPIARQVVVHGTDAASVGSQIVDTLAVPGLRLVLVFGDWRIDQQALAAACQGLRAPVLGCSAYGVIGPRAPMETEVAASCAIGLYGEWLRVGIGVAPELERSPLTRSRDAVARAATMLGVTPEGLDPARHVAITLVDGTTEYLEAFCVGSAATAPRIRFVGGCSSTELAKQPAAPIWINGELVPHGGVCVVLDSELPFYAVSSTSSAPTDKRTIVTAATGRVITELDGKPAGSRLRQLIAELGDTLIEPMPTHVFARYVEGVPYVRSIANIDGELVTVASGVEAGHVLRIMRPGDLIGHTQRDLATARDRVGGQVEAFLGFSCLGRHAEAMHRNLGRELAACYAELPTAGFQTFGEQSGMLLVNHTLTGLAIGARP